MSAKSFDISEFMMDPAPPRPTKNDFAQDSEEIEEIDIQKAVVEELASEKALLHEKLSARDEEINSLKESLSKAFAELEEKKKELADSAAREATLEEKLNSLQEKLDAAGARTARLERELTERLESQLEAESRNPNALALLDRDIDIPDRFTGETRDHVLEVLRDGMEKAIAEGRLRRAKLLEGVLVTNEPHGGLVKRREKMEKLFEENGNILTGSVINTLVECGIAYRDGEKYLLPSEIIKRTY